MNSVSVFHASHTNRGLLLRDELKRHYTLGEYWLEVEMEDVSSFDEELSDCLYKSPTENLNLVRRKECYWNCALVNHFELRLAL